MSLGLPLYMLSVVDSFLIVTLSGPGGGELRGPDEQTHSCQSETSYP